MDRGDGPLKVLSKVGANPYKLELPGDMVVSATFNVGDLSPYVKDEIDYRDLRVNLSKQGRMVHIRAQFRTLNQRMG